MVQDEKGSILTEDEQVAYALSISDTGHRQWTLISGGTGTHAFTRTDAASTPNQSARHPLDTFRLACAGIARTFDDRGGAGRR